MEFQLRLIPLTLMEVKHEYALETTTAFTNQRFDAIVLGWHIRHFIGFNLQNDTSLLYD
jgi:hypothetical protein